MSFSPAISKSAKKAMRSKIRKMGIRNRTELNLEEIAKWCNPILNGWIAYYGHYNKSALESVMKHFNHTLVLWAMRKFEKLRCHKTKAFQFIDRVKD